MFRLFPSHHQAVQQTKGKYTKYIKFTYVKFKHELHQLQYCRYTNISVVLFSCSYRAYSIIKVYYIPTYAQVSGVN